MTKKNELIDASFSEQLRKVLSTPNVALAPLILSLGHKGIHIFIADAMTGDEIITFQTSRKPNDLEKLVEQIRRVAVYPDDVLRKLPQYLLTPEGKILLETTAYAALKRKSLGGRKNRGGITPKTAEKYKRIAKQFYDFAGTQEDFCRETGITKGVLRKATKFASGKSVPKSP